LILDYINEVGNVSVQELMQKFGISKATINRDLAALEQEGKIVRVIGGAVSSKFILTYEPEQLEKEKTQKEYKEKIGSKAVELIKKGMTVILDSGTTTLALAGKINENRDLTDITIITNDMKVGMIFAANRSIHLIVLGGQMRRSLFSLSGVITLKCLECINADIFFLAADAVDIRKGISNANFDEVEVKRKMMDSAKQTVLLADYTKFNSYKIAKVCSLEDVDKIITDHRITNKEVNEIKEICRNIIIAD
jgi:Transcriptional regulators of sugar metabolism